jgi:PKD repeat protein
LPAKDFGKVSAGLEVGVEGSYNRAEISTQKVILSEEFVVNFVYGNVNPAIADANYRITPFVYWAYNGALVVDYAVQVENSSAGFPTDWWRTHYGRQPDPAFLLPWRLERERLGYATPDYKLNLTKDILFDPPNAQAGEVVTLTARIHNYSLLATSGPTAVRFYLGDPDAGGSPIVGLNGESQVLTAGPIQARGNAIVRMPWRVPEGLRYPRIYAVIDPDGQTSEVHEDNNKAYAILGAYDGSGPPLAGFSSAPAAAESLAVKFNNTSGGEYTTVEWDFGDGATSNEKSPTHTYAAPGAYTVTLRLTGGPDGLSDTVQQSIQVGAPPVSGQPPAANDDSYQFAVTGANTSHTLMVLANDSDPDGDGLTIVTVSSPVHGSAMSDGQTIVYTLPAGYEGADSFTYTIDDGHGNTATATVTITITNGAAQTQAVFLPLVSKP